MHALDVAGALLDHGHVVHFADDAQDQFHRHVDAAGARVVVEHHRHADGFAHRAVVLEHFRLVELPVGDRQDHHRLGAEGFGELRAAHGLGGGQVGDADDGRHAMGDGLQGEVDHLVPFRIAQVGAFAGAAERGDGMHAAVDQALDGAAEGRQVETAVGGEGGDGVADDAVDGCGHWMYP